METNIILKKKLLTYVSEKGQLRNIPEDVLFEVLKAWQSWTGHGKDFYKTLGFSQRQMATLLGKAKKLQREGYFGQESFKEVLVSQENEGAEASESRRRGLCEHIELDLADGRIIRFPQINQLMEFLKKAC